MYRQNRSKGIDKPPDSRVGLASYYQVTNHLKQFLTFPVSPGVSLVIFVVTLKQLGLKKLFIKKKKKKKPLLQLVLDPVLLTLLF